jgi:hypothetical protein
MSNRAFGNIYFHSNATAIGNGAIFKTNGGETMNIIFKISSGGTFTAAFEGQIEYNGDWFPIPAANLTTLDIGTTASDASAVYQIDLTGLETVRVRLSALSGTITVFGKGVN